jgi:rhodanese-related sulfurtransferase
MKMLIVTSLLLLAAAGAYALDLGGIFRGTAARLNAAETPAVPAPSAHDVKPGNCDFPVNIKPDEAHYFIEIKDPIVIDIRTKEEYDSGHLEAADMQLDYYAPDFKDQLDKLDRNGKYLLYCRSGRRTGATLGTMGNMGFTDIHHIEGGITAWIADGWPVVR